jgi:hypothetical protein
VRHKLCEEKIFGPTREKLTGHWRKMFNRKFVISTLYEIGKDETGGACGMYRGKEKYTQALGGET